MPGGATMMSAVMVPQVGAIDLEFSTFTVEGRPDLAMLVFNPATEESRQKIEAQVVLTGKKDGN